MLKKIYGTLLAASLLAVTSCEKIEDFGDLNSDPNQTTKPIPSALLTNTLANLGNNLVWDQGGANTVAGLYAQYFSETQYTEASRYARPTFNIDGYYTGPLYDLQNIINYNSNAATAGEAAAFGSNRNQIAIARILRAHYFKFLTDLWGDIPYSQSLKGSGLPAYDRQEQIYPDLIKELREAVDQFDNGATMQGDIMYGGNVARWKKYANSLRALIALNMAKANPTLGRTEFAAAIAHPAGVIEVNADNAMIDYPGGNFSNPFYNYYNVTQRTDYAVSKTVTDRLTSTSDERINAYAENTTGFPYGLTRDNATAFNNTSGGNWSYVLNAVYRSEGAPLVVIGAAHVWLARAEAAQRGWTSDLAATAYTTGIQRSWEQWGVYDATDFAAYMAQGSVALTAGTELEKIATQEWLAWYPNGHEGYNTWRRTGFPVLTPAPGTTAIPRRFPYGSIEYNVNTANVTEAGKRYTDAGVDNSQFARIWWDRP